MAQKKEKKLAQHQIAERLIKSLVGGHIHSFLLIGKGGMGKTEVVLKTLAELKMTESNEFLYLNNHTTPKRFFQLLKQVNELRKPNLLLLDDFDIILKNKTIVGMLRSALWGDLDGKRKVSWYSTTSKEDEEFYFEGKVIFLLNALNMKDPLIQALISRGFYYNLTLSNPEIIALMQKRTERPYQSLTLTQRKKVLSCIAKGGITSKKLTLRTLEIGYTLFLTSPNHYQHLLLKTLDA